MGLIGWNINCVLNRIFQLNRPGRYMLESTQLQLGIYVVIFLVQNNYESSCRNLLVDLQTEN